MTVYLVGAGPGDPGLLTVRGLEVLRRAEVVLYDRLASPALLDHAPEAALRVDVGKRPGGPMQQDSINDLLIEHGRAAKTVVRLKAGDPFVFGRGGEEAQALIAAGVPFEVVPGVTSAIAVPAYAGIPITHRGASTSFTVVTGHSRHEPDVETNWEALAAVGGTIVVLMGVAHRAEVAARLMHGGLPADTPVAAVRWGTRAEQHTQRTTLEALPDLPLEPPVTLVIGAVASLDFGWWERRALWGKRIVVTRAREQASELVALLDELGAEVFELPTIETVAPSDGGAALRAVLGGPAYDWVVFTSANAVARVLAQMTDLRWFGPSKIAAIGTATAATLADAHLVADLVPARAVAEGLLEEMPAGSGRILLPRAAVARDVLPTGLREKGWTVDVIEAYRTVTVQPSAGAMEMAAQADAVTFTSSSTVTNYLATGAPVPPLVVCMGAITAATARDAGLHVDAVAEEPTIRSLVDALTRRLEA